MTSMTMTLWYLKMFTCVNAVLSKVFINLSVIGDPSTSLIVPDCTLTPQQEKKM